MRIFEWDGDEESVCELSSSSSITASSLLTELWRVQGEIEGGTSENTPDEVGLYDDFPYWNLAMKVGELKVWAE